MPDLPKTQDTNAVIQWVIDNSNQYKQTGDLMKEAANTYSMDVHKQTFENLKAFLAAGGISGNVGGFEAVDDPAGGTLKVRAACTLLGYLGFPVHHAYYQQNPMDSTGKVLSSANGPFVLTLPKDGVPVNMFNIVRAETAKYFAEEAILSVGDTMRHERTGTDLKNQTVANL